MLGLTPPGICLSHAVSTRLTMNDTPFSGNLSMPSLSLPPGVVIAHSRQDVKKPTFSRNARIAIAVVVFHIAFIWALQSGLILRAAEIIVPAEVLAQFVEPPAPKIAPVPPVPPAPQVPPKLIKKAAEKAPVPLAPPAPQPLAILDPAPAPNAPTGVATPQPALAPAPIAAVASGAPAGPTAAAAVQLPSSDASYLQNPKPPYPPVSRRLNEQGKSVIRVMIGIDGLPKDATVAKSSGFDRLDQAALTTVMRWRFVAGKRGGIPEAMWFNVPINWVLE